MSNADLDNFDPELDALLEQARWPEPSPQAVNRLRNRWGELSEAGPRRVLRIGWTVAAAAVLVLAVGVTWFLLTQGGQVSPTLVVQKPVEPPALKHTSLPPDQVPPSPSQKIVPRAPTPRETLAVLAVSPAVDAKAIVREALDAAARDDVPAAVALLRSLRLSGAERELSVALATTHELPRRRAAVRLLSETGTPSSLPLLTRLAKDPKFSAVAMPGVARLGGTDALLALARAPHPDSRREAIGALLKLHDKPATSEFLAMVLDDTRRDDALAALHASAAPPVEQLIANLDHPQVDRRFAAAKALGSLCDRADVGKTLRRMVNQNDRRREALAALLSCPSREAATFIDAARARTSSIDAEVRAVQTELRRMF